MGGLHASPFLFLMLERACVFVDGENLRHSLVDLFPDFSSEDYLPKTADWEELFNVLVGRAGACQRIRTYWYVVQHLDFWPWRLPFNDIPKLEKVLCKYKKNRNALSGLEGEDKKNKIKELANQLSTLEVRMRNRFRGWDTIHNAISGKCDAVEFRRAGAITFDLFRRQLGTEKSVDVKLAIDLLELRDIYDVAIIVSGDQDYVPAVQAIKDRGKQVINVSFKKRDGYLLPGGARRLNQITDKAIEVPYDAMKSLMGL